jgi:hypothetical protein
MSDRINVTCKGSDLLPIDKLNTFQGDLKILDDIALSKLKKSILKHGFTFPFCMEI